MKESQVVFILHDQHSVIKVFAKQDAAIAAYQMAQLISDKVRLESAEVN